HGDAKAGEMGFAFERLGCRVPAIAVSAYTARNTIVNDEMNHGSVIKTLSEQHGLKPLSRRDESANSLSTVVNLENPRHPDDWPETSPQWLPDNPQEAPPHPGHTHKDKPLSPPGRGLVGLVEAKFGVRGVREAETYEEAYTRLKKHGSGVMGA
ncbi:MAG: alkaline phosphatase family protein, partial [Microbacterium sp.]